MNKKERAALRKPFLKEFYRKNTFNLIMTVIAALLASSSELVISWSIKGISDLISGDSPVGKALLGAKVGDQVHFDTPGGTCTLKVLEITH